MVGPIIYLLGLSWRAFAAKVGAGGVELLTVAAAAALNWKEEEND